MAQLGEEKIQTKRLFEHYIMKGKARDAASVNSKLALVSAAPAHPRH